MPDPPTPKSTTRCRNRHPMGRGPFVACSSRFRHFPRFAFGRTCQPESPTVSATRRSTPIGICQLHEDRWNRRRPRTPVTVGAILDACEVATAADGWRATSANSYRSWTSGSTSEICFCASMHRHTSTAGVYLDAARISAPDARDAVLFDAPGEVIVE
jgi:hypothetical protein